MARIIKLKVGSKFYPARAPKNSMSSASINRAIGDLASGKSSNKRLSDSKKCLVVFFRKGAKVTATQRCEGRKMPKKRNPNQCRNKKKLFVKCVGGRKRRGRR